MTAATKEGLLKYEEARKLAASDDGKARLRLAKRVDVQPEILYFLAVTVIRVGAARLKIDRLSWLYLIPLTVLALVGVLLLYLDVIVG